MTEIEKRVNFIKKIVDEETRFVFIIGNHTYLTITNPSTDYKYSQPDIVPESMFYNEKFNDLMQNIFGNDFKLNDNLDNCMQLNNEESIKVLIKLIEDEKYRYFVFLCIGFLNNEFLANYKDLLWGIFDKFNLSNPDILIKLAKIEGKDSKALPILVDLKHKTILDKNSSEQLDDLLLEYKINDSFFQLTEKIESIDIKDFNILAEAIKEIKSDFEERLKLHARIYERKHEDLFKQINEHDSFISGERKEGLQKQIDLTNTRFDDINNRLNDVNATLDRDKKTMQIWLGILTALVTVLIAIVAIVFPILLTR